MKIVIRKAVSKDIPSIHNLVNDLAHYEKAPEEFVVSVDTYQADFKDGVFDALVAEEEDKIVGMALFYLTYSTWKGRMLYLEDFIVLESYRRNGIGQQLFDAFLTEAKRQDCALVKWQVLDWNQPAIRFYEKNHSLIEKEWWNGKIIFERG